jgi:Flp pilus assembly protein TadG
MIVTAEKNTDSERGSLTLPIIILVTALMMAIGLVVDGSGKIQAGERANQIASSAARAAASSLTGDIVVGSGIRLDATTAQNTALAYIAAADVAGTAAVTGDTITVTVTDDYTTVFLRAIGITTLTGSGTAQAQLFDG